MRLLVLASLAAVAACASNGDSDNGADLDPATDPRVGDEQQRICFTRRINAFAEYGDDDGILLREGVNEWYLVTVAGPCPSLGFAQAVGLGPDLAGAGCLRRSDRIWVSDGSRGRGLGTSSCLIDKIYAYDPDAEEPEDEADDSKDDGA